jgi:hypothetical protein
LTDKLPDYEPTLPQRFFQEARRLFTSESDRLHFEPHDLLKIAQDAALRAEFRSLYSTNINDPALEDLIVEFLEDVATDLEDKSKITEIKVELLDRAGLGVAASVTAAGIAAIVATGGALGPIVLVIGGVVGIVSTGAGRTILRTRSQRDISAAQKIRRLAMSLGA